MATHVAKQDTPAAAGSINKSIEKLDTESELGKGEIYPAYSSSKFYGSLSIRLHRVFGRLRLFWLLPINTGFYRTP